jgi:hypothetical protein
MGPTDIKTMTIPVHDDSSSGAYYCATSEDALRETLTDIERHLEGIQDDAWKVAVLNGCGVTGLADQAAEVLKTAGFDVVSTGNAESRGYDATRIRYLPEDRQAALAAAAVLGAGQLESATGEELQVEGSDVRVSIVVGRDFARRQGGS